MVDPVSTPAVDDAGPSVQQVRLRLILVGPLRLVLGVIWLVAALAAGATHKPALIGFGVGIFWTVFLIFNDPRARFRKDPPEPRRLPANARVAPAWKHAVYPLYPSTAGVSVLAAVSLPGRPILSALMAGIVAGLGIAALISLNGAAPDLYVDARSGALFRK